MHHFIAGVWDAAPVETELLVQADRLVVGGDAVLVIDDTAIPKKGTHSVGVAAQYASALGKTANCQTPVSLTLARGEVPVMLALRLFLPASWTSDRARLKRAGVPAEYRTARTKPEIALAEIDRVIAAGVRFGCVSAWMIPAVMSISAPTPICARSQRYSPKAGQVFASRFSTSWVADGYTSIAPSGRCCRKTIFSSGRARLIQDHTPIRIVDSKIHSPRFDYCVFLIYRFFTAFFWAPSVRGRHHPLIPGMAEVPQ
jgi:hypothetical protein